MKKILYVASILILTLVIGERTLAQSWQTSTQHSDAENATIMSGFQDFSKLSLPNIAVPTVIIFSVPPLSTKNNQVALFDQKAKQFIPYSISYANSVVKVPGKIVNKANLQNMPNLLDDTSSTFQDFPLTGEKTSVSMEVTYDLPVRSSQIRLTLAENSSRPDTLTLTAYPNNTETVIKNNYPVSSYLTVDFPEVTSKKWTIELDYSQPLRVSEVKLNNLDEVKTTQIIQFLATPGSSYSVYSNPEKFVRNYADQYEKPNFNSATNKKDLGYIKIENNPLFIFADTDADKIPDVKDNCVAVSNFDQLDADNNGKGDVCDDYDLDGIINSVDNCPNITNYDQKDTDLDHVGDKCDPDESRLTEKYPFIVWIVLGVATLVFLVLLYIVGNKIRKDKAIPPTTPQKPTSF